MSIKIQFITRPILAQEAHQMWQVYHKYYEIDPAFFRDRITQHDLLVLFKVKGQIIGFTGILRQHLDLPNGKKASSFGLGITVIDSPWRGHNLVQRTVLALTFREFMRHPFRPLFVWSVALTIRPYLVFAKGLKTYYPRPEVPVPDELAQLCQQLCERYYLEWDLDHQLVYFYGLDLKNVSEPPTDQPITDPRVAYYYQSLGHAKKLGFKETVGIFTIAPANWENIHYWFHKMAASTLRNMYNRLLSHPIIVRPNVLYSFLRFDQIKDK